MIYFSGLDSVIESIYLGEDLGNKVGECDIFVNPERVSYIADRVVIISSPSYPESSIETLLINGNKVISRVRVNKNSEITDETTRSVLFQPYIMRVSGNIIFSGLVVPYSDSLLRDYCTYDPDLCSLYFPKLSGKMPDLMDDLGNLSYLGWALHQVGQNTGESCFKDLDIVKLKKIMIT